MFSSIPLTMLSELTRAFLLFGFGTSILANNTFHQLYCIVNVDINKPKEMLVNLERLTRTVCTILINRPEKRNALNLATIKSLQDAFTTFERDESLYVAILGGVGGNFCAGYDLSEIVDPKSAMPNISHLEKMLLPLTTRLSDKKIVIASIDGHAAGVGFELALRCDFRIADRDARMGFLNRRFGIPIMNGGTVILPKLIGQSRAMELVATGKAQLAPESLQYGVINYLSDIGCALGRSANLARSLSKFDQLALIHDLKATALQRHKEEVELLRIERMKSLEFLKECGPLMNAAKFLEGTLCRHGNTDLGNSMKSESEVTL